MTFKKGDKPRHTAFKKGQSGNPSGRPKVAKEIKSLFRSGTPAMIKRLQRMILQDENIDDKVRLAAIKEWLDRDLGKVQTVIAMPTSIGFDAHTQNQPNVILLPKNGFEVAAIADGGIVLTEDEDLEFEEIKDIELKSSEFKRKD